MPDTNPNIYAVVEIMGHRTRAGAISDATIGGATLLRIEHPSLETEDGEPIVEFYAPQAIFAIAPCSLEVARRAARYWRAPDEPAALALAPALEDLVVDDDYDGDESEPF